MEDGRRQACATLLCCSFIFIDPTDRLRVFLRRKWDGINEFESGMSFRASCHVEANNLAVQVVCFAR